MKTFKTLIVGHTQSGKTTAANMISEMTGSKVANSSEFIIRDYAKSIGQDPEVIQKQKFRHRVQLYNFGRQIQAENPQYPVCEAIKEADIVAGIRNKDELDSVRDLFDVVLWINRDCATKGETDNLSPVDADITIDNNGSFDDLRDKLKSIVSAYSK